MYIACVIQLQRSCYFMAYFYYTNAKKNVLIMQAIKNINVNTGPLLRTGQLYTK